jgi:hypothetical protein
MTYNNAEWERGWFYLRNDRRIVSLMERELRIYEMSETANPVSLARSRLLHDRFPPKYAATRARRAISLKAVRHGNDDLWSFVILPDAGSP